MLPDELRDKKQENEFLQKNKDSLPEKIIKLNWLIILFLKKQRLEIM